MAAKKAPSRRKSTSRSGRSAGSKRHAVNADGKNLVIVESPAKAKTINRYLGPDFVVTASVGHVRDLPAKAPKGSKQAVPGVDLENDFEPTYEVLAEKMKVVTELKKAARNAREVWFATDLDREGEAIAWHLAQELGIDPTTAKRVVFNAITKSEIEHAFREPHPIDMARVDAQQARRILDRIVGYQVSPLLWKKVARGLSAGRVQSVATRLIVEREREIRKFVPDEYWKVTVRLSVDPAKAAGLIEPWDDFMARTDERGKGPTLKDQNAWLAAHGAIKAELVELDGSKFDLGCKSDQPRDLSAEIADVARAVGMDGVEVSSYEDPDGKGPARMKRTVEGAIDHAARYRVQSIETKRTVSRPPAPFITSTLQMAASSELSFGTNRTMRCAQSLYEGVNIPGEGQVGLITYMRTDSTHLSGDALEMARRYIGKSFGGDYLPEKPNFFGSTNKQAQEAHEAIRPTDVWRHPDTLDRALNDDQAKLYRLIWRRFVGCQMTPAAWNSTAVLLRRADRDTGAVLRTTGRVLVFDGFYRVAGVPTSSDEQTLPDLAEGRQLAPFSISPQQSFTSPPPRYTEASLVKTLEAEGIGRPSTYASIIQVIQDRRYVEQVDRRFHATDLGEVVTDKLIEGFPHLMDTGYTRHMEAELDQVANRDMHWVDMLREFYEGFSDDLAKAHETMSHAKAETVPAIYRCPRCGSRTNYRFGKNGRFLSCAAYPECDYAAPIDREGRPLLPERVNVACPIDGSPMIVRTGRFGKFIASINYPEIKFVINLDKKDRIKYPAPPPLLTELPCPKCQSPLNLRRGKRGPWLGCSTFPKCRGRMAWTKVEEPVRKTLEAALEAHEADNPQIVIRDLAGTVIPDGTPLANLTIPGGLQELDVHPDAAKDPRTEAA